MPRIDYDEHNWLDDAGAPARTRAKKRAAPNRAARDVAEAAGLSAGFKTTYRPSRHEAEWLLQSLSQFFAEEHIVDVEAVVKGGKEATVYRCAAHPIHEVRWLAAKVYRPRQFRALNDDSRYQAGRPLLNSLGGAVKETDRRMARAIDKRTSTGVQAQHTSWLMYEYTTLERLWDAGAAVPRPYAAAENALLMDYVGDEDGPAPTLNTVRLDRDEAERLYREVLEHIELMLAEGTIHGDLSAYNILYDNGEISLIDFPQVVDAVHNSEAFAIFERDVTRICSYFRKYGIEALPEPIVRDLWARYRETTVDERLADESRLLAEQPADPA